MSGVISKSLNFARDARAIMGLSLERGLKRGILKAWLKLSFSRNAGNGPGSFNLAGLEVGYCSRETLLYLFREIFINQAYWFVPARPAPFIIDCGSNIGMSVIYFKLMFPGASVLAFEPDGAAYACLERNISVNGLAGVRAFNRALSAREGEADFFYYPDNPGALSMSLSSLRAPGAAKKVRTAKLSGYIDREVDFLKLDIEGAETEVLAELASAGKLAFIRQMAVEYHHHIDAHADSLSAALGALEDAGFGYQLSGGLQRPFKEARFQDILIYAYRKK